MSLGDIIDTLSGTKKTKEWTFLKKHLTPHDIKLISSQAQILNPDKTDIITLDLLRIAIETVKNRETHVKKYLEDIPEDWYMEPFYYTYVQFFGTNKNQKRATFKNLINMFPYLKHIGIKNLYLLPHYESPLYDHGYDVSNYTPAKKLGGSRGYNDFMKAAIKNGFRVVTDAVFNHTSIEHPWFKKALSGDEKYLKYYLQVNDWTKKNEKNINGDIRVEYTDSHGNFMERTLIFPDITRTHYVNYRVNGKNVKIYSEFYPFQVDLDLQNPEVLLEIWKILGAEANSGVLGKRTDAIAHWLKPRGRVDADGNPETFALHSLLKMFLKIVSPKSIIIPETVRSVDKASQYLGENITFHKNEITTQGDAMFNFHAQGCLREALCFQSTSPWWNYWQNKHTKTPIPNRSTWLNLLGHHDEIYMGFVREEAREAFRKYIKSPKYAKGYIFKEGMSAGARTANCLLNNENRIAMAFFLF